MNWFLKYLKYRLKNFLKYICLDIDKKNIFYVVGFFLVKVLRVFFIELFFLEIKSVWSKGMF